MALRVVDTNAKIEWAGFNIELQSIQDYFGGAIRSPSNFYLNPVTSWDDLERSQKKLDNFFEEDVVQKTQFGGFRFVPRNGDMEYYDPDPEVLKPGMYVVVQAKIETKSAEWHRALILEVLKEQNYKVFLIDYGEELVFPLKYVRYLPTSFLAFPAQAVRCRLDFGTGNPLNRLHSWKNFWKKTEGRKFLQSVYHRKLKVEFLSYEIDMSLTNPIIWLVKMQRYDAEGKELEPQRPDETLLQLLGTKWVERRKKDIENNQPPSNRGDTEENPGGKAANAPSTSSAPSQLLSEADYDITSFRKFEGRKDIINVSEVEFKGLILSKKWESAVDADEASE